MKKAQRELIVINTKGLHARPASMIAKVAADFEGSVAIYKNEERADAKSVLSILMLAAGKGTPLVLSAQGENPQDVLDRLEELFLTKFNED